MRTAIAILTRDLRLRDNPVLAAAHKAGDQIVPLFVFDEHMLQTTANGRPNRRAFLAATLRDLDDQLRTRGGAFFVRRGSWVEEVVTIAKECEATSIHIGRDVSGYAQTRLAALAAATPIDVVAHESVTVVPPETFGRPYLVFTPYYKRWLATEWRDVAPVPRKMPAPVDLATGDIPAAPAPLPGWPGGERAGLARVKAWTPALAHYDDRRDDAAADATSRVSPYLHFGCVSALELARRLRDRKGGEAFVRQLAWRDFYAQLLWFRPELAHDDVRPESAPRWRNAPGDLEAWKAGRTGFPFVDAGMRQLRAEGWMPNRLRMVTASFLTKDLRIDWREGAQHFLDLLVDGDVANNQLNWQWVAGTGTDANPHRVLNPTLQGRKHDPDGAYVRRWIAELRDVADDVDVHDPPFAVRNAHAYPEPILEHAEAIELWRASRRD
jgi:deoxyribodipyrimidine photo-lyase